jgi:hypothetical protein
VFRNEEGVAGVGMVGDLNDPAELQRRERLRKKQELQMQFQLKRKGRPKNESWNQLFTSRADPDSDAGSQTNAAPDTAQTLHFGHFLKFVATNTANNLFIKKGMWSPASCSGGVGEG